MTVPSPALGLLVVLGLVVAGVVLWPSRASALPGLPRSRQVPPRGSVFDRGTSRVRRSGQVVAAGRRWRSSRRRMAQESELAELLAAVAAPLRAGVPPAVALAAVAATVSDDDAVLGPLVRDLAAATAAGMPVAAVWRDHARGAASPDLAFVGRAWALSELTGAALADALVMGEQVLRARARARQRLAAASAGPKASMAVLCLLPASGPVVGAAMGVDPLTLYFSSPVAASSLVLGVVLGLGAWWWSRRILRGAA